MPKVNRINWTYVGNRAGNSLIELRHFLDSGNLVVFCNKKILLTDFDVFGAKEYSFFIGEEFCKISINEHPSGLLGYDFEIVEDVDTPLNRWRKKLMRKDFIKSSLVIGGIFLGVIILVIGAYWMRKYLDARDLKRNGIVKTVSLTVKPHMHHEKFANAIYSYYYNKYTYTEHIKLPMNGAGDYMTENGFPLRTGDRFMFTFSSKRPGNSKVDYMSILPDQLDVYRERTDIRLQNTLPEADSTTRACILSKIYEHKGISGWADVYYQQTDPKENWKNNQQTYQKLLESEGLRKAISACY